MPWSMDRVAVFVDAGLRSAGAATERCPLRAISHIRPGRSLRSQSGDFLHSTWPMSLFGSEPNRPCWRNVRRRNQPHLLCGPGHGALPARPAAAGSRGSAGHASAAPAPCRADRPGRPPARGRHGLGRGCANAGAPQRRGVAGGGIPVRAAPAHGIAHGSLCGAAAPRDGRRSTRRGGPAAGAAGAGLHGRSPLAAAQSAAAGRPDAGGFAALAAEFDDAAA